MKKKEEPWSCINGEEEETVEVDVNKDNDDSSIDDLHDFIRREDEDADNNERLRVQAIKDQLAEENPEAIIYDDLDDALIGICSRHMSPSLALYDEHKIHQIHMTRDGMTEEEAIEYYDYNIAGAWMGEYTPFIVNLEGVG